MRLKNKFYFSSFLEKVSMSKGNFLLLKKNIHSISSIDYKAFLDFCVANSFLLYSFKSSILFSFFNSLIFYFSNSFLFFLVADFSFLSLLCNLFFLFNFFESSKFFNRNFLFYAIIFRKRIFSFSYIFSFYTKVKKYKKKKLFSLELLSSYFFFQKSNLLFFINNFFVSFFYFYFSLFSRFFLCLQFHN